MKKQLLSIMLLLGACVAYSQSWKNSNALFSTDDISIIGSTYDNVGNTLIFGYYTGSISSSTGDVVFSLGDRDLFIAKFDPNSALIWLKSIGGRERDSGSGGIAIDNDNNVYVTGGFRNYLHYSDTDSIQGFGLEDIFLAKYAPDGTAIWCRNAGSGNRHQRSTTMTLDNHGDLMLAGYFFDSIQIYNDTTLYVDNAFKDYYYAKHNTSTGDLIWAEQVKSLDSNYSGFVNDIISTNDNYYLLGVFADSVIFGNDTLVSQTTNYYDSHIVKTDTSGVVNWIRKIQGSNWDYLNSGAVDQDENIYAVGYYDSDILTIDSTETETILLAQNFGDYDYYVAKYSPDGNLIWIRNNGGVGKDRLLSSSFFNNDLQVTGYFTDTMNWGGISLTTDGALDTDMFYGSIDTDGNYRSANSYGGRNNSDESGRDIFVTTENTSTIIRSNSDLLLLGDSVYTTAGDSYYLVVGSIGCLPISVDNTIPTNITGCYGDSTGSIQVVASGGFGAPWLYSIDNSQSSSDVAFYPNLPAGDYQIVVIDAEGCTEVGPLITLTQPDSLEAILVSSENIIHNIDWLGELTTTDGSLVVTAAGGTGPYTFTLLPGGTPQALGTYYFPYPDSGKYVVAVNDLNNCGPTNTDTVVVRVDFSDATGIDDYNGAEVKLYPNPTSGIVTIEMPFEGRKCKMEVVSMTGQTVLKRKVFPSGGIITETIDLSDQAKGLYVLRMNGQALKSTIVVK